MSTNVLQKVLEECRNAMFARIPIVYIKTDDDVFIRKLVMTERNPLVVLRSNIDDGVSLDEPIYGMDEKFLQPQNCTNFTENKIKDPKDIKSPWICTKKMPSGDTETARKERETIIEVLESYVLEHEDPKSEQYDVLQNSLIILYSSEVNLSSMLKTYTEIIELDYPTEDEIKGILQFTLGNKLKTSIGGEDKLLKICSDLLGFTAEEITVVAQKIFAIIEIQGEDADPEKMNEKVLGVVRGRKKQKLQGGLLEQCKTDDDIGGMGQFKQWLEKQKEPLEKSNEFKHNLGINPPNGVLLCGIPGCGKTLAAKFAAKALGETITKDGKVQSNDMTLLKMDIGSLMDKYQGESEHKMREALKLAEAMSPCVLLIDEIEKGFSGAKSGGDDSSSFKRMFGYMLGWMQDNESPCFIFATSNDISGLPKEFFRSGRFDALYAVFLPTAEECAEVFAVCAKKAEKRVRKEKEENNEDKFVEKKELPDDLLFCSECKQKDFYIDIVNKCFIKDGKPRIVIGSDIQKIFDNALRGFSEKVKSGFLIEPAEWKNALKEAIDDPTFATYGEGEENLDSIVLGYCRLLRKGFVSTSEKPLFSAKDYKPENTAKIDETKTKLRFCKDPEESEELNKDLEDNKILQKRTDLYELDSYDLAVYNTLYDKINSVAYELEKHEKDVMIRR